MTTYIVTNKATGAEITRYAASAPVEQLNADSYPFTEFDHTVYTDAPAVVVGPRVLTKREWRLLFTDTERLAIDKFNATFEANPNLTEEQRDAVRSGLEDYKAATEVSKEDPATALVLGLYVALGILATSRPAEILA